MGYHYCVATFPSGTLPDLARETTRPANIPSGQLNTRNRWYQQTADESCGEIVAIFGIFAKGNFTAWNPRVGSRDTNLSRQVLKRAT
jgi:hypothetical protein